VGFVGWMKLYFKKEIPTSSLPSFFSGTHKPPLFFCPPRLFLFFLLLLLFILLFLFCFLFFLFLSSSSFISCFYFFSFSLLLFLSFFLYFGSFGFKQDHNAMCRHVWNNKTCYKYTTKFESFSSEFLNFLSFDFLIISFLHFHLVCFSIFSIFPHVFPLFFCNFFFSLSFILVSFPPSSCFFQFLSICVFF
jgi:hypothetical protein